MCVRSIFYFTGFSKYKGLVQEIVFLVFHRCLYNKQNITCPLVDTNFIFSCSTRYLTSERSERVRYRVEHSKIKFVSTRGHVISSNYFNPKIIELKIIFVTDNFCHLTLSTTGCHLIFSIFSSISVYFFTFSTS